LIPGKGADGQDRIDLARISRTQPSRRRAPGVDAMDLQDNWRSQRPTEKNCERRQIDVPTIDRIPALSLGNSGENDAQIGCLPIYPASVEC
jgi:hypothetical protein